MFRAKFKYTLVADSGYEATGEYAAITPEQYGKIVAILDGEQPAQSDSRDAERYRWMRRTFVADDEAWPDDVADARTGDELDAAVDAALAHQSEGGEKS